METVKWRRGNKYKHSCYYEGPRRRNVVKQEVHYQENNSTVHTTEY